MIRLTASEFTNTKTGRSMKEDGKMTCSMVSGSRRGKMEVSMRGSTAKVSSMARASIFGPTSPSITAIGRQTKSQALASSSGRAVVLTKDSGKTTTCTEREFTGGVTADPTKGSTTWTGRRAMEFTRGQTDARTRATGKKASRKEKDATTCRKRTRCSLEFGTTASESSGLMSSHNSCRWPPKAMRLASKVN